ncbi:MAG: amino acid adenylation domain-containing protein [Acidobacteria bacterium]|nr:amino acid adenylation domain-containing protein [Acidobacteriota bacterium]
MGWFTCVYPVLLDVSYNDTGRQIKEIKETLRRIPHKGIGYGLLKYLAGQAHKEGMSFKIKPRISFNYLGQFDADIRQISSFGIAKESAGNSQSLKNKREYLLEITGMMANNRLTMTISYNKRHFKPETISRLMEHWTGELHSLIAFCSAKETAGTKEFSPSDFTYKDLTIEQVERLMTEYPGIVDVYPLTPMQEGMLFHALADDTSASYFEQMSYRLEGHLDIALMEKSFNELFKRHDILRTAFVYKDIEQPLQVVLEKRAIDFYYEDISRMSEQAGKENRLREFKSNDKARPFDLSKNVLMRVAIFRLAEAEYEFIWSSHHILVDGWCMGILNIEFFEIFNSLLENRVYRLPAVKPYRSYIQWLANRDKSASAHFWQNYLGYFEEKTGIPRTTPANENNPYQNEAVSVVLDSEKTTALNNVAGRHQVTVNTVAQVLWGILLGKYNQTDDVVFGAVVSGRPSDLEGVETMVGLFINAIPVRIRFEAKTKLNGLLKNVQEEALAAESYHYYPLADIQAMTALKQNLIDHIMVFENYPVAEQIEGLGKETNNNKVSLKFANVEVFEQSNYDFNIVLGLSVRLSISFRFNRNVYAQDFVEQIARHFCFLIEQVIETQDQPISALTLLPDEEKQRILFEFNNTAVDFPQDKTIPQLFAEQAERIPSHIVLLAPCVEAKPEVLLQITYGELNYRSSQLARGLNAKGVGSDNIVGIMIERSVEMVIGLLGILKAGGAYLPIDPAYPQERIDYMLKDSNAAILLTDNCQLSMRMFGSFKGLSHSNHLAYVIYTSGTTGKPKGVMVMHRSVVNTLLCRRHIYQLNEKVRALQLFSFAFDGFVTGFFNPITAGGMVVLPSQALLLNIDYLRKMIHNNNITHILSTPSLYSLIINNLSRQEAASLAVVSLAGERMLPDLVEKTKAQNNNTELYVEYGVTEASVMSTLCRPQDLQTISNIGSPTWNTQIYILDKHNNMQPIGVAGEIWIAGEGLARGYLNQPVLTAEKFRPLITQMPQMSQIKNKSSALRADFQHSAFSIQHSILYCTGDLGRWLPNGTIEYLNRIDDQVKVRGFRIELGEIESKLLTHASIKDAVVLCLANEIGDNYLCAYFVPAKADQIPDLQEFLAGDLPGYMIPTYFIPLPKLPLTPNGKIDRRTLSKIQPMAMGGYQAYQAPRDEIEQKLVQLWAVVLGRAVEEIGIADNFFQLGGHSLKATVIVSLVHREFDVKVPLREIFRLPKIKELAAYIKEKNKEHYISIEPVEKKEYYLLSSAQKRLYILQQMKSDSIAYNLPEIIPLARNCDVDRISGTFKKLLKRHESLRTSFHMHNTPVQVIHDEVAFELDVYDAAHSRGQDLVQFIKSFVRPFDLAQAPLIRTALVKEDKHYFLVVDLHHIAADGVSHEILVKDFTALYEEKELQPLRIQYKDFSQWQHDEKDNFKSQETHWLTEFAGEIPVLNLPTDYPRPLEQGSAGDSLDFLIEGEGTRALRAMALAEGATLFMVLTALYNVLLAKLSGQEDIVIGTPIAGRRHPDLEKIIGMFVNTLPLRNYPNGERSFNDFLKEVKERTLMAFENQDYPFEELVDKLAVKRDLGRNPLFDIMLVLQNMNEGSPVHGTDEGQKHEDHKLVPGGSLKEFQRILQAVKFDLTLTAIERGDSILLRYQYSIDLFKKETVERFIVYFHKIAADVMEKPGIKIAEIDILSAEERNILLYDFNSTGKEKDYPSGKTIPLLFAEQVERTPDYIALHGLHGCMIAWMDGEVGANRRPRVCPSPNARNVSLTYHELNEQSGRLAGVLIEKGVQADMIVAIMMERSIEMAIGILGIMKSGGAYLPIDPGYPPERIEYMLKDSNAKVLIINKSEIRNPKLETNPNKTNSNDQNKNRNSGALLVLNFEYLNLNSLKGCPRRGLSNFDIRASNLFSSNLAYIIYTSGTTGRPKGVMVEHGSAFNTIYWRMLEYKMKPGDIALQLFSFAFDGFITSFFTPLVSGAAVVQLSEEEVKDAALIEQIIVMMGVSHFICVPSLYRLLLAISTGPDWAGLKIVTLAGEKVHPDLVEKSKKINPLTEIVNEYGPTEGSVVATFNRDVRPGPVLSIGKPIDNAQIYIIDKYLDLVSLGVPGELAIAGKGLARGYLNNPELTAEKFRPLIPLMTQMSLMKNKSSALRARFHHSSFIIQHSNLYRTGDLARWLRDGSIEFLGRIDHQVKIRGYRIELGEIENSLLRVTGIKEAVVVVRDGNDGDRYLCAYFVCDREYETKCEAAELRETLAGQLPGYMIPAYFVKLEKIPLTPNGKVNLGNLPGPVLDLDNEAAAPRTELESRLAALHHGSRRKPIHLSSS